MLPESLFFSFSGQTLLSAALPPFPVQILSSASLSPFSGQVLSSASLSPFSGQVLPSAGLPPFSGQVLSSASLSPFSGQVLPSAVLPPFSGQVSFNPGSVCFPVSICCSSIFHNNRQPSSGCLLLAGMASPRFGHVLIKSGTHHPDAF